MITSLGSNSIVNLYLGNTQVDKAYLGDELVWPANLVQNYITFKALTANSAIGLDALSDNQSLEYSTDRNTWNTFDTNTTINLTNVNDKVYVRGILSDDNNSEDYTRFTMSGQISVSGNSNALWNYTDMDAALYAYCGAYLFNGCTALYDASNFVLGKDTISLTTSCYNGMFRGCVNLATAPELPATTLASGCYAYMFYGCTSLTTAPVLIANPGPGSYTGMFQNCTNLEYVKCLSTNISALQCTTDWLDGVASVGVFVSNPTTTWSTGASGIPAGWIVGEPEDNYLTLDILTSGDIAWKKFGLNKTLYYSINNGSWTQWDATTAGAIITVSAGDRVRLKGTNNNYATSKTAYCGFDASEVTTAATYNIYGNTMSLLYGDNFVGQNALTANYTFCQLFKNSKAVSAKYLVLPAITLIPDCYRAMFSFATLLTDAPKIPATTVALECCWYMFEETAITKAPDLLAPTLAEKCYGYMFNNCHSLNYIKCLATDHTATNCTQGWTTGVASGGTFVKDSSVTWGSGVNGVPSSWTIVDA